ncbi:hypothetical protein H310_04675 [Aphanomyces invadans]|uniref:Uncharacterized protein n=1 Tax=Aphanomyces invadans TaxID=157072 RepID=A0A024UEW6_9STRA|nr:hypothetical protein H310_04675 [Aphanomyces invadans]ETW04392.1 hypothetical protein H310_04675 [Aphanomyces invadans]|eukprot:XP_008867348.1 hypothetical protein H310_04675 [Aphanomyces invadans]
MKLRDRDENVVSRCRYKFGKCLNPRTFKINGTLHSLCTMHRQRQNAHQLKSDRKRRQRKSLQMSTAPTSPPASKVELSSLAQFSPFASAIPFLDEYSMRSNAIGEALYYINYNFSKLTQLLINHEVVACTESCSGLLSLNPANRAPLPSSTKMDVIAPPIHPAERSLALNASNCAEAAVQVPTVFDVPCTVAPYNPRHINDPPLSLPPFSSLLRVLSASAPP